MMQRTVVIDLEVLLYSEAVESGETSPPTPEPTSTYTCPSCSLGRDCPSPGTPPCALPSPRSPSLASPNTSNGSQGDPNWRRTARFSPVPSFTAAARDLGANAAAADSSGGSSPVVCIPEEKRRVWVRPGVRRFLLAVQPVAQTVLLVRGNGGCGCDEASSSGSGSFIFTRASSSRASSGAASYSSSRCSSIASLLTSSSSSLSNRSSTGFSSASEAGSGQMSVSQDGVGCGAALLTAVLPHIDPDGQFFGNRILLLSSTTIPQSSTSSSTMDALTVISPTGGSLNVRRLHSMESLQQAVVQPGSSSRPLAAMATSSGGNREAAAAPPTNTTASVLIVTTADRTQFAAANLSDHVLECQPYRKEHGKYDDVLDSLATLVSGPELAGAVPAGLRQLGLVHAKLQPGPMMQALQLQVALKAAAAVRAPAPSSIGGHAARSKEPVSQSVGRDGAANRRDAGSFQAAWQQGQAVRSGDANAAQQQGRTDRRGSLEVQESASSEGTFHRPTPRPQELLESAGSSDGRRQPSSSSDHQPQQSASQPNPTDLLKLAYLGAALRLASAGAGAGTGTGASDSGGAGEPGWGQQASEGSNAPRQRVRTSRSRAMSPGPLQLPPIPEFPSMELQGDPSEERPASSSGALPGPTSTQVQAWSGLVGPPLAPATPLPEMACASLPRGTPTVTGRRRKNARDGAGREDRPLTGLVVRVEPVAAMTLLQRLRSITGKGSSNSGEGSPCPIDVADYNSATSPTSAWKGRVARTNSASGASIPGKKQGWRPNRFSSNGSPLVPVARCLSDGYAEHAEVAATTVEEIVRQPASSFSVAVSATSRLITRLFTSRRRHGGRIAGSDGSTTSSLRLSMTSAGGSCTVPLSEPSSPSSALGAASSFSSPVSPSTFLGRGPQPLTADAEVWASAASVALDIESNRDPSATEHGLIRPAGAATMTFQTPPRWPLRGIQVDTPTAPTGSPNRRANSGGQGKALGGVRVLPVSASTPVSALAAADGNGRGSCTPVGRCPMLFATCSDPLPAFARRGAATAAWAESGGAGCDGVGGDVREGAAGVMERGGHNGGGSVDAAMASGRMSKSFCVSATASPSHPTEPRVVWAGGRSVEGCAAASQVTVQRSAGSVPEGCVSGGRG